MFETVTNSLGMRWPRNGLLSALMVGIILDYTNSYNIKKGKKTIDDSYKTALLKNMYLMTIQKSIMEIKTIFVLPFCVYGRGQSDIF